MGYGIIKSESSWIIHKENSKYYAKSGDSGKVEYKGTIFSGIINSIATSFSEGGHIHLRKVEQNDPYMVSTPMTIVDAVRITGEGMENTFLKMENNANCNMFEYTLATAIYCFTLEGMTIIGNGVNQTSGNIVYDKLGGLKDIYINDVFFDKARECLIREDNIAWAWRITNNIFEHSSFSTSAYGVRIDGGSDVRIIGNKFLYNHHGLGMFAGDSAVIGNYFYKNRGRGLTLANSSRNSIIGNVFSNSSWDNSGVYSDIHLDANNRNNVISGNVFYSPIADHNVRFFYTGHSLNLISSNEFIKNLNGAIEVIGPIDARIYNNIGFNPVGLISTPFSDSSIPYGINLIGTNTVPTADRTYEIQHIDSYITSIGGTGVSITVMDYNDNTIVKDLTSAVMMYLPMGYKIHFGSFSVAPTVIVAGN